VKRTGTAPGAFDRLLQAGNGRFQPKMDTNLAKLLMACEAWHLLVKVVCIAVPLALVGLIFVGLIPNAAADPPQPLPPFWLTGSYNGPTNSITLSWQPLGDGGNGFPSPISYGIFRDGVLIARTPMTTYVDGLAGPADAYWILAQAADGTVMASNPLLAGHLRGACGFSGPFAGYSPFILVVGNDLVSPGTTVCHSIQTQMPLQIEVLGGSIFGPFDCPLYTLIIDPNTPPFVGFAAHPECLT
jgi:hypothetical protein